MSRISLPLSAALTAAFFGSLRRARSLALDLPVLLALVLATTGAASAQGDAALIDTPPCHAARRQLEAALDAGGPRDRVVAAREQAALDCFGVRLPPGPASPPGARAPVAPLAAAVEPIRLRPTTALGASAVPAPASAPAAPATSPALPATPLPVPITSCDAAGCWGGNGLRYQRQGPLLLGPDGVCTQQDGAIRCP